MGYRTFRSVDLLQLKKVHGPKTFCTPLKLMLCYKLNTLPVHMYILYCTYICMYSMYVCKYVCSYIICTVLCAHVQYVCVHIYSTYVQMYSMYTCAYVCTVRMCTYTPRTVCTQRTRTERIIVSTSTLVNKKMSPWARFYRPPPPLLCSLFCCLSGGLLARFFQQQSMSRHVVGMCRV